jgi:hypothetical protein
MREGTTKLLAACKHSNQTLEAAKSLLTSNERMIAYMSELQRRRAAERQPKDDLKMYDMLLNLTLKYNPHNYLGINTKIV